MRLYHNTRKTEYRSPFGAVLTGSRVRLAIDVFDEIPVECSIRLWVDGKGERLIPMTLVRNGTECRYTGEIYSDEPAILWYSFIIRQADGTVLRYGAKNGSTGGEGQVYDSEPPSFQLTVSRKRTVPDWYKNGIVYQIFPDRFSRDAHWRERAEAAADQKRCGPQKSIVSDWYETPRYKKDDAGRVTDWEFYGGTIAGITEKISYLREMGVTVIYLNPVFEAASNHRYDTGDYTKIDPMLGTNDDFAALCKMAEENGISVILDGVFNHTGCDSVYFNKYGNYRETGAYQSEDSPYRDWYRFDDSEIGYECWWNVDDLPNANEDNEAYRNFIWNDRDSIVRRWMRAGAKGWRLDVADELPDSFIAGIKQAILEEKPDEGVLLGEVWEDASNKISYGKLRSYLLGDELDSTMNYPLRDGIHGFVKGEIKAPELYERLMSLYENYPREIFYSSLNLIGSHDRARVLTLLGDAPEESALTESERAFYRLSDWQKGLAKGRLWLMVLMQMTLPGVPCIYYGDEAGLEGYSDPYNRAAYPWGREDKDVGSIYRNALALRRMYPVFTDGDFEPFYRGNDVFGFFRSAEEEQAAVIINSSRSESYEVEIPAFGEAAAELVSGLSVKISEGKAYITLRPMASAVIHFYPKRRLEEKMERGSGVLCHVTSVPNDEGPGNIGEPSEKFVDFLAAAKQKYWQILPLNPTDEYGSPYAGASAFAGNVSLLGLSDDELQKKYSLFVPDERFNRFCAENDRWLSGFAMFSAIRERYPGIPWQKWPAEYRRYAEDLWQDSLLAERGQYHKYCQYLFHAEWSKLRKYANDRGIKIIGDMPMYVSADSSDAWTAPEMFTLDENGCPAAEAGVPPDYFAKDGQLWGNPLYNWDIMKDTAYDWWLCRLRRAFSLYDYVRLDHFRGFESYWYVPAGERATAGKWLFGPGADIFLRAYEKFGPLPVVAEDLGMITPAVRGLVARCGFPGTDVMQFADTDPLAGYVPPEGKIAYTGTHDNATLLGWCKERYPKRNPSETAQILLEEVFSSGANVVITPLQDILGLGDEARMNTPGTTGMNWRWQAKRDDFGGAKERLLKLTINSNRS